jgi:hypothetical protein
MIHIALKETPVLLGIVDTFECPGCLNISNWNLLRIDRHIAVYFIPIIPIISASYKLKCASCNHKEIIRKEEIKNYKSKLEIEESFLRGIINEYERKSRISEIDFLIENEKQNRKNIAISESSKWTDLTKSKTDEELLKIYFRQRHHYNPSMIIAVKAEIDRRRLPNHPT